MVRKGKLEDYWARPANAGEEIPTLGKHMGLKRYEMINRFLTVSKTSLKANDFAEPLDQPQKRKRKRGKNDNESKHLPE
jgi:hypothetical protein